MRILEHLLGRSGYNKKGEELPDPTPKELKIDLEVEMPLELKVMRALQSDEWKRRMEAEGRESFEEANDFYIDEEEPEFKSFHEDEEGDVMAYEEGLKRGFVEEIPTELKERVNESSKKVSDYMRKMRSGHRSSESSESTGIVSRLSVDSSGKTDPLAPGGIK